MADDSNELFDQWLQQQQERDAEEAEIDEHDAYAALSDCIKGNYTREEWLWLSDAEKTGLIEMETEPEAV